MHHTHTRFKEIKNIKERKRKEKETKKGKRKKIEMGLTFGAKFSRLNFQGRSLASHLSALIIILR